MDPFSKLFSSPLMPALILWTGPVLLSFVHPSKGNPTQLRMLTLLVMILGLTFLMRLDSLPGVPQYVWQWQPEFQLLWINLPWNWAIALLAGLLGFVGILLSGHLQAGPFESVAKFLYGRFLAINLATIAITLMLVSSANILALVFMWVAFDVIMVIRQTLVTRQHEAVQHDYSLIYHRSLGLNLLGTLVLLIGLFPAGEFGPRQMLTGSILPPVSIFALLLAAALRAGVYPLHLWLLPSSMLRLNVAERIFSQILPALTGIWLLGFTLNLSQRHPEVIPLISPWAAVAFGLAGLACLHIRSVFQKDNYVVVTAFTLIGLVGFRASLDGLSNLLLPVTAVALGSPLWLLAGRLPLYWQRNLFHSLGAACLLGWPLTPMGPLLEHWFNFSWRSLPNPPILFSMLGALGFSVALWLPLFQNRSNDRSPISGWQQRAWAGLILLAMPLLVFGLAPSLVHDLLQLERPSYSTTPLWRQLVQSVGYLLLTGLGGISLAYVLARRFRPWGVLVTRISGWVSLEWLSAGIQFSTSRLSLVWDHVMAVLEGPGLVGWGLILTLMLWTILQ